MSHSDLLWERRVSGGQYLRSMRLLESCPPLLQDALAARYAAISGAVRHHYAIGDGRVADTWNDADTDLRKLGAELRHVRPGTAFDDDEIEAAADRAARFCMQCRDLAAAVGYAERQGMVLPCGDLVTPASIRKRLNSADWWRRRLRTVLTRRCEELFRRLGFVRRQASAYVSGDALARVRAAAAKGRRWLADMSIVCQDTGEVLPLAKIAEHSLSNPKLRRGELMTRARGFQETAEQAGHRCLMVTLTCPSAFHAWLRESGDRNPRYNGASPRDGQAWLNKHWARGRAALKRCNVTYYGFRAAEPHHDGTPHWHMVLYVPPESVELVKKTLGRVWLKDYADEPGAQQHRIKFTDENPEKGSGVGYLAKYVAKNVDGFGSIGAETSDESNRPVSDDAEHAIAWARLHGIRQFQQLGGPAVTLWRELRRVREPCEWPPLEALRLTTTRGMDDVSRQSAQTQAAGQDTDSGIFSNGLAGSVLTEDTRQGSVLAMTYVASASDITKGETTEGHISNVGHHSTPGPSWARFIQKLGGVAACGQASRALFDKAEPRCIDRMGRNVLRLTRWGEFPAPIVIGVKIIWRDRIRRLATRVHVWFLVFTPFAAFTLGPVAITVRGAAGMNEPTAWTNPNETSQAPPGRGFS